MSNKVTHLINNDNTSTSSKNLAAQKANIPIITEEEYLELCNNNKIKEVATKIVLLEQECQQGNSNKIQELEKIVSNLSLEEMLAIDEYIYQKKLLTK